MIHEPEFIRGNQKSYVRIVCDAEVFEGYEYQMYKHNVLKSLLGFQCRSQNGKNYLYYEVSSFQSLDIFLQTQKLRRDFAIAFAKGIVRLCKELSEYALDINGVVFIPKFVMVSSDGEEIRFIYSFHTNEVENEQIEKLLECCIEYLDYKDEELMGQFYKIYENLLEQRERFALCREMETLLSAFAEEEHEEDNVESMNYIQAVDPFQDPVDEVPVAVLAKSKVAEKEFSNLKKGTLILFVVNIAALVLWRPLTILKIFFCVAVGVVLLVLNICIHKKERKSKETKKQQQQLEQCMEEYEAFSKNYGIDNIGTQIITVKDSEKFLYNVQNVEPQYIFFSDTPKIIGKDSKRVQICIPQEGVSRVHALILREDSEYKIEDLNSTNGTWVNGKALTPRKPCILKEGDRVRFAEIEYIFR